MKAPAFAGVYLDAYLEPLQPWLERVPDKIYEVLALLVYARADMPVGVRRFREILPSAVGLVDRYARLD